MLSIMLIIVTILTVILSILLPPLYDGIHRKIKARIHCRIGPPIIQTWYDLIKLFGKTDISPNISSKLYSYAPYLAFSYLLVALLITPFIYIRSIFSFTCDLIVLLYLLSSASVFLVLGGFSSGNVFAYEGARRELMIIILTELTVIFSITALAVRYSSLMITDIYRAIVVNYPSISSIVSSIAIVLCGYIEGCRFPFELSEAEPEIAGGIVIEYSGKRLALFKLSVLIKQFILVSLAVDIIEPWSLFLIPLNIPVFIVKTLIVYVIYAFIDPLFGRYRVFESLKTLFIFYSLAVLSLIFAVLRV